MFWERFFYINFVWSNDLKVKEIYLSKAGKKEPKRTYMYVKS